MTKILLNEPVEIAARKHLGAAVRTALYAAQDGKCEACGEALTVFEVDHRIPLAMGGVDQPSNWQALCEPCHLTKTKADVKAIAKAKRIEAGHKGEKPPPIQRLKGRPFPRRWERA